MKPILLFAVLSLAVASGAAGQPLFSLPDSGSTTFGDWSFSWTVNGHDEGLSLTNVRWKGTSVLYKGSMPVVRVKYRGDARRLSSGCGPYADQLGGLKTDELAGVPDDVNVVSRLWDGTLLELAVYDEIGGYDLYQAWYFHTSGWMQAVLYSRGWSCGERPVSRRDHKHHPYWRLDFDVESTSNRMETFTTPASGPSTFVTRFTEGRGSRLATEQLLGARVTSGTSSKNVTVSIGGNELRDVSGPPWFSFSNKDLGWRLYKASEDDGWPFGALGHLGFDSPPESISNRDVVLWSVAHLSHTWDGADPQGAIWHSIGATIRPSW